MKTFKFFENPSLNSNRNNELNEYRKIGKFTDLTLRSTDGHTMTVHKNILSASSQYFRGMFNSDWVESRQKLVQLVDDVKLADLEILIEYFYTGKAKVFLDNAENLFIKAQYFNLVELMDFCTEILIDNIKIENCMNLWRNSEKYLNENLKIECLKFIKSNLKSFLESYVMNLTPDEFKIILSQENFEMDQENLFKFMSKWVKADFDTRNLHLTELIRNLDFMTISDEFIETEIMTDEILHKNREFSIKMVSITFQKLRDVKKQLNIKSEEKRKNIYLITRSDIYKLNLNERKWMNQFNFEKKKKIFFATVAFKDDIYISGGCDDDRTATSNFESWNSLTHKINKLPQMIETRILHKLVEFKAKIYCCGGITNKGSTELFDLESSKWTKGPNMNESKTSFSLINTDDSIYAFGGWKRILDSNIAERLDPREGKWNIISTGTPNSSCSILLSNNSVYCFDNIFGGYIFDLRTNTWTDSIVKVFNAEKGFFYYGHCYDVVEFNNEIFGVFQTDDASTWGTFKYDRNHNKWANLNIPLNINPYDIKLCVSSDP